MKKVIITGASGFIGQRLCSHLDNKGYKVQRLGRKKVTDNDLSWSDSEQELIDIMEDTHGIIHLAGENVAGGLFTSSRKKKIMSSRVDTGERLVSLIKKLKRPPKFFFQASAVGFYGSSIVNQVTESQPQGEGFLADVCNSWEKSTLPLEEMGIKRAVGRIGIVLGEGGFLAKVAHPMRFFAGGHLGDGSNYIPWVHIDDCISAIFFLFENNSSGTYNISGKKPVTSREFFKELGSALNRPSWFHVPKLALSLAGEFGNEVLMASQNVIPEALNKANFSFKFESVNYALEDIYS